jgi:hypothetical protein
MEFLKVIKMTKNKPPFLVSLIVLVIFNLQSSLNAKVFQSDKPLGTCAGAMESPGVGEVSEERKKQEKKCEKYDNEEKDCKRQRTCKWVPKPKVCEAIKEDEDEEAARFCDAITDEKSCRKESSKCVWGYKAPVCSAKNPSNEKDVEYCEKYDGTSEDQCERSDKCFWD